MDMDIIDDKVVPVDGSIKIVRIDGILDSKQVWNGTEEKWKNICRHNGCKKDVFNNNICEDHYNEQIAKNVNGEKMVRGQLVYSWSTKNKKWELLCNVHLCSNLAVRRGKCNKHANHTKVVYSSQQNMINIFYQLKHDLMIKLKKDAKTACPDCEPPQDENEDDNNDNMGGLIEGPKKPKPPVINPRGPRKDKPTTTNSTTEQPTSTISETSE